jgi:hypothetical protein
LVFGAPGHVTQEWGAGAAFSTEKAGAHVSRPGLVPASAFSPTEIKILPVRAGSLGERPVGELQDMGVTHLKPVVR